MSLRRKSGAVRKIWQLLRLFAAVQETDWTKTEVIDVSGTVVTLRLTGAYRNGTSMTEFVILPYSETAVIDLLTGKSGGSGSESGSSTIYGYIFLGNLNGGDQIPPLGSNFFVNKKQTRTYLGSAEKLTCSRVP
jgi:hypothetical protein